MPEIVAILRANGFDVEARPTTAPGHATELAAAACASGGCDVVFGLGGDGTLREIAVALLGSGVALALLPGGTTNVLALALEVPADPLRAAALYRARTRAGETSRGRLDVGLAIASAEPGAAPAGIPFLMMVSAGVDSEILRRASQRAKRRFGRLAVAAQALGALRAYRSPLYDVVSGERRIAGTFFVASNIRYYGGPFEITPRADPLDGRLDFAVFRGRGRGALFELALDVLTGTQGSRADFATWQGAAARLEGSGEVWVQIDGDPMRLALPVEIALSPARLWIFLPANPQE